MQFRLPLFIACLPVLLFTNAFGQSISGYDPKVEFSPAVLKEDLHVLHETLTELDPALYRYKTKRQVDSMFAAMAGQIKKPMTEDAFKKDIILPAVVFLQDLHFVVYPSGAAEQYYREHGNYFPFDVKVSDNKMYLWKNYSAKQEIGTKEITEIHKINGVSTATIINNLKPYIVADGTSTTTKKIKDIEESFRTYYAIVYGRPEEFTLTIKSYPGDKTTEVKVPAASWREIDSTRGRLYPAWTPQPALEIKQDISTAILTFPSFDARTLGMTDNRLEQFIDSAFTAIHDNGIKHLVLDIRGNYGGRMNYGGRIYSYLTDTTYRYVNRVEVRYPHVFPSLVHTSLGRSFLTNTYGMRLDTVIKGDSIYAWETYQWTFEQPPAKTPFTGRLYVLADGYTFSTTGLLASMIRSFRDSTVFIGEETGGAYQGCSGNLPAVTLPHTQLRVHFPIRKFVSPAVKRPERNKGFTARGVIPDFTVSPTIFQWLGGEDAVLNKALELATKK